MTLPAPPEPQLVEDQQELDRLCGRWLGCSEIGLDTEFIRTRTFFPKLGLVQISDPEANYLVDVLAIERRDALERVLTAPHVTKVVHSCSEDLEVLFHEFGTFPQSLFDTQIAATLCGFGYSLGYQTLVGEMFDLEIKKGETRSDWLRRPLRAAQVQYAALDVAYLLPIHEILLDRLGQLERVEWAEEEFSRLLGVAEARLDPSWAFSRVKKGRLTDRQQKILRELCDWREESARSRDLPRSFIAGDNVLIAMARLRPKSLDQLRNVKGLHRGEHRRSGTELLRRVRKGLESEEPLPPQVGRDDHGGRAKGTVDALKKVVEEIALGLDLPTEFLAQRRLLKEFVALARAEDGGLPEGLEGWRQGLLEEPLREELERVLAENG